MRIPIGFGACAAVASFAALGTTKQCRAQGLAWLGGDTVQVAAHRMGLMGSQSSQPLLGYPAKPERRGAIRR